MIACDECGRTSRGKPPQWALDQEFVWICGGCDEVEV